MKVTRRTLLGTIAAGFAAGTAFKASAEGDWPSRVVRLVSPYGAGGASDISLRILAEQFGHSFNQQFIVENKPGAGTRVANELVSRATPDGYTFLYAAAPFATAEALFEKLNYNRRDLQPVAMAMMAPLFLVVNAQAPVKTLQEMIDYGRSKPEGLTFGSPGAGSQPHLAAELLFRDAGVKGLIVPFRGDNMAYTELLASRLDATLTAIIIISMVLTPLAIIALKYLTPRDEQSLEGVDIAVPEPREDAVGIVPHFELSFLSTVCVMRRGKVTPAEVMHGEKRFSRGISAMYPLDRSGGRALPLAPGGSR